MKTDRFHLEVLPIENIFVHEEFDPRRSADLIAKLKKGKIFTDPIIVAPFDTDKYIELDGMNRLNCFKKLGIKTILCQIVDYTNQEQVILSSWIHLFKAKREDFFNHIKKDKNLIIKKADIEELGPHYIKEDGFARLITIIDKKEGAYIVFTGGNFIDKINRMKYIVSYYKENINRAILPFPLTSRNIKLFFCEHPDLNFYEHPNANLMIVFPNFTPHQIIKLVEKNVLLPAGITRHLIKYRCLNIDLPLDFFDNKKTLEQLNKEFDQFILKKNIRIYEEATVHFE